MSRASLALCASLLCACPSRADRDSTSTPTTGITGIVASSAEPAGTAPSTPGSAVNQSVLIETNTQATFGDVRIGVGNIWDDEYADAAGKKQKGLTAGLWVFEREPPKELVLRVHPGMPFSASESSFEVVRITHSSVELRILGAP